MSIQLIIEGDHVTDLLGELNILTKQLGMQQQTDPNVEQFVQNVMETGTAAVKTEYVEPKTMYMSEEGIKEVPSEKPKKLTGKQHQVEAEKMMDAGEIDEDIYKLLSKKQKERVDAHFAPVTTIEDEVVQTEEKPVESVPEISTALFAPEEPVEQPVTQAAPKQAPDGTVTRDGLTSMIVELCAPNGVENPAMFAKVQGILAHLVPAGQEAKLKNIPEDKLETLYYEIQAI